MAKNLYIDASHPNETRVVLKSEENIEDYEYESISNSFIKNNIYLGKVSRVEPSLQAAFINFGREEAALLTIKNSYFRSFSVEIVFFYYFWGVITVLVRQVGNNEDTGRGRSTMLYCQNF